MWKMSHHLHHLQELHRRTLRAPVTFRTAVLISLPPSRRAETSAAEERRKYFGVNRSNEFPVSIGKKWNKIFSFSFKKISNRRVACGKVIKLK